MTMRPHCCFGPLPEHRDPPPFPLEEQSLPKSSATITKKTRVVAKNEIKREPAWVTGHSIVYGRRFVNVIFVGKFTASTLNIASDDTATKLV